MEFCRKCQNYVDTDYIGGEWDEVTGEFTCEKCLPSEDVVEEKKKSLFEVMSELRRITLKYSVEECEYYKPMHDDKHNECYDECTFRLTRRDHRERVCCYDEETIRELRREGVVCPMWD